MLRATCMIDEAVLPKMDTHYVERKFSDLVEAVAIIFVCIQGYKRKETTWKHKGKTYYYINLPYEQVLAMDDARPLLLEAVAKRLGVPVPPAEEAAAA